MSIIFAIRQCVTSEYIHITHQQSSEGWSNQSAVFLACDHLVLYVHVNLRYVTTCSVESTHLMWPDKWKNALSWVTKMAPTEMLCAAISISIAPKIMPDFSESVRKCS